MRAIQRADGKYQTRHDKSMRELAQVEMLRGWAVIKALLQTTMILHMLLTVNLSSTVTTLAPKLKRQDPEYRAHEPALQSKRCQEAKASSK